MNKVFARNKLFLILITAVILSAGFFVQNTSALSAYPRLDSIAITTPATKLGYTVGDTLDLTGLVVTGTYTIDADGDKNTKVETITAENITGFDSSTPVTGKVLTITVDGITTNYTINVVVGLVGYVNPTPTGGGGGGYSAPVVKAGDANGDGKIDELDFSILMADWGKTGSGNADLNKDNVVDELDFSLLMANWGL